MASFDNFSGQSDADPGVEDGPGVLQSPTSPLHRTKSHISQVAKSLKSKRSLRPVPLQHRTVDHQSTLTPIQRFRTSARKVMHLNKTSSYFSGKGPGAEPGIDIRKDSALLNYGHIRQNCLIEIADYSGVRSSFGRMTNREFVSFLNDPAASEREHWVKVRWINVGGISWDVVRALALRYGTPGSCPVVRVVFTTAPADLHPLSLEDLLRATGGPRSGADYYKNHLFIRILSHTLSKDGDEEPDPLEQIIRTSSPEPFEAEDGVETLPKYPVDNTPRSSGLTTKLSHKLGLPRKSGTIEPGGYDVESVDVTKPTAYADYGSLHATYVDLLLPFLLSHIVTSIFSGARVRG